MCIALWALEHNEYAVILCSNRDELLSRPTLNAHFHNYGDDAGIGNILSGLDVQAGGTWLGVNRTGRVALFSHDRTNITEPIMSYKTSRGHLTSSFLLPSASRPLEYEVDKLVDENAKFAGFNLLLLAPALSRHDGLLSFDSQMVTNHGSGGAITSRPLLAKEKLCGCVSNAIDGIKDDWPKVQLAIREFEAILRDLFSGMSEAEILDRLFGVLSLQSSEPVTERGHLRNTIQVQPFLISLEGMPTAGLYGTRLSTVLLIKKDGQAVFIERDIWQSVDGQAVKADPASQRVFRFQVKPTVDLSTT